MRLVIDTNIVMSALIRNSKTRALIESDELELVSPDFVIDEIYTHKNYICEKSDLLEEDFELLISLILEKIEIIPIEDYKNYLEKAKNLIPKDIKDVPFVACCLALECDGIWTNDSDYSKANVNILNTKDILKLIEK